MAERPSIARAIGGLLAQMPPADAGAGERAAFCHHKASVLLRIADEIDDPDMAAEARTLAEQATRQAAKWEAQ